MTWLPETEGLDDMLADASERMEARRQVFEEITEPPDGEHADMLRWLRRLRRTELIRRGPNDYKFIALLADGRIVGGTGPTAVEAIAQARARAELGTAALDLLAELAGVLLLAAAIIVGVWV